MSILSFVTMVIEKNAKEIDWEWIEFKLHNKYSSSSHFKSLRSSDAYMHQ